MDSTHSHWLRRVWDATQRVPRLIAPSRRPSRRTSEDNVPHRADADASPRDDFPETAPLVFPLH
jgi:hypothetical protein